MKYKLERIQNLLKREILILLSKGVINDPRVPNSINITRISVSKDLHYAHIHFTVFGTIEFKNNVLLGLNHCSGFIQKNIGHDLELKYTPKIEFRYDENYEKAEEVNKMLDNLTSGT